MRHARRESAFTRGFTRQAGSTGGFTLIEMMIVVAIVAVLASVAVVAYTRHLKSARVVEGHNLVARVQTLQEAYFGRFGWYCNASGKTGAGAVGAANFHPLLIVAGGEPVAKDWTVSLPAGWNDLGFRFDNRSIYFGLAIVAGLSADSYALDGTITTIAGNMGLTAGQPWFYVMARADLDGVDTDWTQIWASSERRQPVVMNQGL